MGFNQIYQSNQSSLHVQELDKRFVNQLKIGNENINPSTNNNVAQNKQSIAKILINSLSLSLLCSLIF